MQPLWAHQQQTVALAARTPLIFDTSDPGTGKTRSHIEPFRQRKQQGLTSKCLVLCPKSLMRPAWANDIHKYAPELAVSLAYAQNRNAAFNETADVFVTNIDAVRWLVKQTPGWFKAVFGENPTLIIDESTAYKNPNSARSKAARAVAAHFVYISALTGTPTPNSVTELWNQIYLLDRGERLGRSFTAFRRHVQDPVPQGAFTRWEDKPHIHATVSAMVADISIRHQFDEVMDVPENFTTVYDFEPPHKLLAAYEELKREAVLELESGEVTAVNAAVLSNKLLQIASGAIYTGDGNYAVLDTSRYEFICDLIEQRDHSVVFFNWRHQRDELARMLDSRGISFSMIDGSVPVKEREEIVSTYQGGHLQTLLLNPQTGAHGLTLTRGRTTIWSSPRYEADFLKQGIHRIYRGGQTKRTENILVQATNTLESHVYARLNDKHTRMVGLLDILRDSSCSMQSSAPCGR